MCYTLTGPTALSGLTSNRFLKIPYFYPFFNMYKLILYPVFFLSVIPASVLAGGSNTIAPKYSNEFLSIGTGARGLALGGSQIATVGDVTAGYWNPSGLTHISSNRQFALMHNEYFAGIAKYDYLAFAAPVDATRTIALSLIRFGIDDIPDTSELIDADGNINYDRLKSFSAVDWGFLFSYGKLMPIPGLRMGTSAKIIYRKAGDFASGWGFGIDLGAQYNYGTWRFGCTARDVTTTFNTWTFNTEKLADVFSRTQNELPESSLELTMPRLLLGAGKKFFITQKFSVTPEAGFDITFDGKRNTVIRTGVFSIDPHAGAEISFRDLIHLRTGINNIQQVSELDGKKITVVQPNIGVGVKIKNLSLDYALTNLGQSNGLYSNVFSLKIDLTRAEKPQL